jgi:hypothetical protein
MIISIKELSKLIGCSDKTGSRIAKEIRELYGVDHITIYHVSDYFKLHPAHIARWWLSINEKDPEKLIMLLQKLPVPPVKKLDTYRNTSEEVCKNRNCPNRRI